MKINKFTDNAIIYRLHCKNLLISIEYQIELLFAINRKKKNLKKLE